VVLPYSPHRERGGEKLKLRGPSSRDLFRGAEDADFRVHDTSYDRFSAVDDSRGSTCFSKTRVESVNQCGRARVEDNVRSAATRDVSKADLVLGVGEAEGTSGARVTEGLLSWTKASVGLAQHESRTEPGWNAKDFVGALRFLSPTTLDSRWFEKAVTVEFAPDSHRAAPVRGLSTARSLQGSRPLARCASCIRSARGVSGGSQTPRPMQTPDRAEPVRGAGPGPSRGHLLVAV
jgi:hypothetical protein